MTVPVTTRRRDLYLYRKLPQQARPYWLHIVGIFLLDLVATPRGLLAPLRKELVPECQPAEAWSHVSGDHHTYVPASLPRPEGLGRGEA